MLQSMGWRVGNNEATKLNWAEYFISEFCKFHWAQEQNIIFKLIGFPSGLVVKNPSAMQEMRVQSLGWENPLKKEITTYSSIIAWEISWTEEPGGLQSMEFQRISYNLETK